MGETNKRKMITATELKQNLGMYLDYVSKTNEVIISKNGQPIARLSPYINDIMQYMILRERAPKYDIGSKMVSYDEFLEISSQLEGRIEYINGEIILQASPNSFHQEVVGELHVLLKTFFSGKSCKVILAPFDVTLYKDTLKKPDVIQPDLLVACDTKEKINEKGRYSGVPTLVIEVLSPSTQSIDMIDKLNSFMLSNCREYWIVDISKKKIYQYGFKENKIELYEVYGEADDLTSYAFHELIFKVNAVFDVLN